MAAGDFISLHSPATGERWKIPVLFEDDLLLALDKPSRLLIAPDRWDPNRPNLMKLLHEGLQSGAAWVAERGTDYLANVHRLDFETSGIILLAKSKEALTHLANQFGSEQSRKTYFALAHGLPEKDEFAVDLRLAPHPRNPGKMVTLRTGKRSLTQFVVEERFSCCTLIRCHPLTGRSHQIRIHLKARKLPIVGDETYGGRPLFMSSFKRGYRLKPGRIENPLIDRVALHAAKLEVKHPADERALLIQSPLPHDMEVALKYLRRHATLNLPGSSASRPA